MTVVNMNIIMKTKLTLIEEIDLCNQYLGYPGRILSGSKTIPKGKENHIIYWNACIFDYDGEEIWYGDLDVTQDHDKLDKLVKLIGIIYVTPEQPWRFDGFKETRKNKYHAERMIEFKD